MLQIAALLQSVMSIIFSEVLRQIEEDELIEENTESQE